MTKLGWFVVVLALVVVSFSTGYMMHGKRSVMSRAIGNSEVSVLFSPKGGCADAIIAEISKAKKSIRVQAYSFTSDPIEAALVQAHIRGVKVTVIVDRSQAAGALGAAAGPLHEQGIEVLVDAKHAIAHNKVMIVDDEVVITGSYNFTKQAEIGNAENLLIIRDAALALKYAENWHGHAAHSEKFK